MSSGRKEGELNVCEEKRIVIYYRQAEGDAVQVESRKLCLWGDCGCEQRTTLSFALLIPALPFHKQSH